jgi:dGTPase
MFDWLLAPLSQADKSRFMSFNPITSGHSKTQYKSFDCSIMELADDIAYGIHDLEDAIVMGIVTQSQFMQEVAEPIADLGGIWLSKNIMSLAAKLFSHEHHERKDAIGALVNSFITCIEIENLAPAFDESLLKYNAVFPSLYQQALSVFKKYVFNRVILKPDIQLLEYKGQQIVMELFEAFSSDPIRLLPENTRQRYKTALAENNGQRVISDYISGMTDGFASRLYSNLFLPAGQGGLDKSVF